MNEAQLHEKNCFITLTYRDEELSWGHSRPTLYPRDFQLFMKNLRKEHGNGIKFFGCGEYGDKYKRPHYHACLFGVDFPDRKHYSTKKDVHLDTSDNLTSIWKLGFATVGDCTFESAAYVARYTLKKLTGKLAHVYKENGIEPEFARMSRGGRDGHGIGYEWFKKYHSDVYPHDTQYIRDGQKTRPPKYYDKLYEIDFPEKYAIIKTRRKIAADENEDSHDIRRLKAKEKIKLKQTMILQRALE